MRSARLALAAVALATITAASDVSPVLEGRFRWIASAPLAGPDQPASDVHFSVKDPTIVRYGGRWHIFCTVRGKKRTHQIQYFSFANWSEAARAPRFSLPITDAYFCAPQVFYFKPHKKWYLLYQTVDQSRKPALQPAVSTTTNISDPNSWSKPQMLFSKNPEGIQAWIDFWIICDAGKAHLFFTSLNGKMWRAEAPLAQFPDGWNQPAVVLEDDIFEASHTYRLKGLNKYLTVVEAQGARGRRYYKAYLADRLDGTWTRLAATAEQPFASPVNVRFEGAAWSDSFSHGELIRDGYDQTLTVDPARLQFLFQGVSDSDRQGKVYGEVPWKLGLLTMDSTAPGGTGSGHSR